MTGAWQPLHACARQCRSEATGSSTGPTDCPRLDPRPVQVDRRGLAERRVGMRHRSDSRSGRARAKLDTVMHPVAEVLHIALPDASHWNPLDGELELELAGKGTS